MRQPEGEVSFKVGLFLFLYSLVFVGVYLLIGIPLFQEVRRSLK